MVELFLKVIDWMIQDLQSLGKRIRIHETKRKAIRMAEADPMICSFQSVCVDGFVFEFDETTKQIVDVREDYLHGIF